MCGWLSDKISGLDLPRAPASQRQPLLHITTRTSNMHFKLNPWLIPSGSTGSKFCFLISFFWAVLFVRIDVSWLHFFLGVFQRTKRKFTLKSNKIKVIFLLQLPYSYIGPFYKSKIYYGTSVFFLYLEIFSSSSSWQFLHHYSSVISNYILKN